MKLHFALAFLVITSLSACGLDKIEIFADETVSDQFALFGIAGSYALGSEVEFQMNVEEGETRTPAIEIIGTALRIDETDADGNVHATAVELGTGEIVYTIGGEEVRRYPFAVGAIERIALEHNGLDGIEGFELENGEFDRTRFSVALGARYGFDIRYEDADGAQLYGAGLLSADAGSIDAAVNRDALVVDTSAAGESSVTLSAGDATTTVTYDVVDEIASLVLEQEARTEGVLSIVPTATDADGRRVYGKPTWRIDGDAYSFPTLEGLVLNPGYLTLQPDASQTHTVEATLLGTNGTIEAAFVYPE